MDFNLRTVGCGQNHDIGGKGFCALELNPIPTRGGRQSSRCRVDDSERNIGPLLYRLEETLPHIFAEQLPGQEGMREAFMQARMVLALVDLTEGPIEKVSRLASANGKIARSDVEEMQRMIAAIGDTAAETCTTLDDGHAEGMLNPHGARDRGGGAGEAATNDAHMERRPPHLIRKPPSFSPS